MAERRMFAKSIINSARFLRMPATSRLLYYDLGMNADDDGVVEAFTVLRLTGAQDDDLRVLVSKGYITILNEDLVSLINDWKTNNSIRIDRYKPSIYQNLLVKISECEEKSPEMPDGLPSGIPSDNQTVDHGETQDRLGKVSIGKERINNNTAIKSDFEYLWSLYPKKKGNKAAALKSYERAVKNGITKETVETAIRALIEDIKKNKTEERFIPYGSTWFNQERWNDSYESAAVTEDYEGGENILDELGDFYSDSRGT